jgi:hypothetical protein
MSDLDHTVATPIGPVNIGSNRISQAIAAAGKLDDMMFTNARAAVCDYVRVQRAVGTAPESIIARVKGIVHSSCPADVSFDARQALMTRLVEWCIETYYGSESPDRLADRPEPMRPES